MDGIWNIYSWIVGIIVIFYFGSRTVEAYVNGKGK